MMKMSAQKHSYYMKRLQLIAIMGAAGFLLFKAYKSYAHVELHMHSLEWEQIQRDREERQKTADDYRNQREDLSDEQFKEIEKDILEGKTSPC